VTIAVLLGLLAGREQAVSASTFTIDPTRVYLGTDARSRVVTLANSEEDVLRFEVSIFAWQQDAPGQTLLTPTDDIVVSPALLAVPSRRQGEIRIGLRSPALLGREERTYRLLIQELPPLGASEDQPFGPKILTRLNVPVFVMPPEPTVAGSLDDLRVTAGRVEFGLQNTGSLHFLTELIRIRGSDTPGTQIFQHDLLNEYVLPGGLREFRWDMPKEVCGRVAAVAVTVVVPGLPVNETRAETTGTCAE
jgi:P pilus assembly chaperone PapD